MKIQHSHHIVAVILLFLMSISFKCFGADKPEFKVPDFAYPRQVIEDAGKVLAAADKTPDSGPVRLRALVELLTAQRNIDNDTIFSQPALIENQLKQAGLDDSSKAMLLALEAEVFYKIYSRRRYVYDNVDAPLEPYPSYIATWSGQQFRTRIIELLDSAQSLAGNTSLSRFEAAVEYSPEALLYIPDVASFIRLKKADAYNYFRRPGNDYDVKLKTVLDEAVAASAEASAPYFYWSVRRDSNPETLIKLYKRFETVKAARYVLSEINISSEAEESAEVIDMLTASLKMFPDWYGNGELKNKLNLLSQPTVTIEATSVVAPGESFSVAAKWRYAREIRVGAYKIPVGVSVSSGQKIAKQYREVAFGSLKTDSVRGTTEFPFKFDAPGRYAMVITIDGTTDNSYCQTVEVTPLFPFVVNGCSKAVAGAVDFTTGAPLADVSFSLNSGEKNAKNIFVGKTDRQGLVQFEAPLSKRWRNDRLVIDYKGLNYDFLSSLWVNGMDDERGSSVQNSLLVFTDRPLYHPGDTVCWAVVAAQRRDDGKNPEVLARRRFDVTWLDANDEEVDSVTVESDELGRISGKFVAPKGRLTGYYTIVIDGDGISTSKDVMVSDYKAPVFEAEVTSVRRDIPSPGCVTVEGRARTYSGMPVADADVLLSLKGGYRQRWFAPDTHLADFNVKTDASGGFTVVIPAETFDSGIENVKFTDFVADITVTSKTAETASTSRRFTTGKPYVLTATVPSAVNSDKALNIRPEALNSDGVSTPIALRWEVIAAADSSVVLSGTAEAGKSLAIDVAALPASDYKLRLQPADSALADDFVSADMAFYSFGKGTISTSLPKLFVPDTKVKLAGRKVSVTAGTTAGELYIFSFVRNGKTLAPVKNHRIKSGFTTLNIELPDGFDAEDGQIVLVSILNGNMYQSEVSIELPKEEKVDIVAETFRDKLVPGGLETWRFRLSKGDNALADAGMIATLYDKALDALLHNDMPTSFNFYRFIHRMDISGLNVYPFSDYYALPFKSVEGIELVLPSFRYYGDYNSAGVMMRRYASFKMAKAESASVENDMVEEYEMDLAAPMAEVVALTAEGAADAGTADVPEYRDTEVALAFWRPSLVTDAEGNVDVVFTVPNANTTWQFRTFGWTKALESASFAAEAVASKPVMVQANLPRFLRQGDEARVAATVFNNSDDSLAVTTVAEIFDIESGAVIATVQQTDTLASKASAVVGIDVVAPTDASAIGYRVRSMAGGFADGEQAAVPVLTSAATVIESTEFYLNPGDTKPFEFTVDASADATLTLSYCQNPVWTIVKAMRGISAGESLTSTGLVSRLFSALAARHLVSTNPDIAQALRVWKENPSEDTLVSMLSKNENLKQLMLDSTPWVQAAASQTQRMEMLTSLLDPEANAKAIGDLTEALVKMQMPDGGFKWGGWASESSLWSTESVLMTLGIARSLGMLDESFNTALSKAFAYLQSTLSAMKGVKTDHELALIASFFPEFKQTVGGSAIIRNTVAEVARNWKKDNTGAKAYDVLILKANGRKVEAEAVLASIRQFGVAKPGQGVCFPNVSDIRSYATIIQAYAAMGASAAELDALRQWVIVQAQALDDLGAWNPDYVIAAVMLTGSDWTSVSVAEAVAVNGKPFNPGRVESMTGYFARTLPSDGKTLRISVKPNGVTPSYGSVVSVSKSPAKSVKARPGRDLSIDKRCLVERDGKWVQTDEFALGERVRVQLTIKANRNLEYVSIDDERPASFEPVDQLPGYVYDGALAFYRENSDASTRLFVSWLPKGTYMLTYDMTAASVGTFVSGIATLQSQYAPELTAHSGGSMIVVK